MKEHGVAKTAKDRATPSSPRLEGGLSPFTLQSSQLDEQHAEGRKLLFRSSHATLEPCLAWYTHTQRYASSPT